MEIYDNDQKNNFDEIIEEDIKIEMEDFENIVHTDLNLDHVKDEVEVIETKEGNLCSIFVNTHFKGTVSVISSDPSCQNAMPEL